MLRLGDLILVPNPYTLESPIKFLARITQIHEGGSIALAQILDNLNENIPTDISLAYPVYLIVPVSGKPTKAKLKMLQHLYFEEPYDQSKM